MQVDELRADGQAAEGGLVEDLVEAVVVLDQLGQRPLEGEQEEQAAAFICWQPSAGSKTNMRSPPGIS